mmetsp:Transcript_65262/g.122204  ORF Transcript_65262/g.122204 Transcript_65262/m.122204 type:complete len:90 (+) Transcript_65262:542-811(+)
MISMTKMPKGSATYFCTPMPPSHAKRMMTISSLRLRLGSNRPLPKSSLPPQLRPKSQRRRLSMGRRVHVLVLEILFSLRQFSGHFDCCQ